MLLRSIGVNCGHSPPSYARLAAAIACSVCATEAKLTFASSASVAGSTTRAASPASPSTHAPSM